MVRGTILQTYHYHTDNNFSSGKRLWNRLNEDAKNIAAEGYTAVWLPPVSKGIGGASDVGYGVKDWFDIGTTNEPTKYGTKNELKKAIKSLQKEGIQVYVDVVLNHLMGGEKEDDVFAIKFAPGSTWTKRDDMHTLFPHLNMNHTHFDVYYATATDVYGLSRKGYECELPKGDTLHDYLMGCDLDFDNPETFNKVVEFGKFLVDEFGIDGFRLDAVKHIRARVLAEWLGIMRGNSGNELFTVGEYLDTNLNDLKSFMDRSQGSMSLFDFPLQRKFVHASQQGANYDLGELMWGTINSEVPTLSVPFCTSHDDQKPREGGDGRGEWVGDWFIPHAYTFMLLRIEGYPMVSIIDREDHPDVLNPLLELRRGEFIEGNRYDAFDHRNTVGWSYERSSGNNSMAIVMTNGVNAYKWLPTGQKNKEYRDLTGRVSGTIWTNNDGWGKFVSSDRSVSVWIEVDAEM